MNNQIKIEIAKWLLDPDKRYLDLPNEWRSLEAELKKNRLFKLLTDIEVPLIPVLRDMEKTGIKIDRNYFLGLRKELETKTAKIAREVYSLAKEEFNLNSPKALSRILFQKLKLPAAGLRKTKTGIISTDEAGLRRLSEAYPIVEKILDYRELFKLLSTYVSPILAMADERYRIHTTFLQTGTATGRLASQEPNMQNLPVVTETGRKIRQGFIAETGWSLVSLDYSQIELRILASLSGDETMLKAFVYGDDIHAITASKIFKTAPDKVTSAQRRIGKTLNFGIVYGMGARSLARTTKLSIKEAEEFIRGYFANFPQVRIWQDKIIAQAIACGFVSNVNGRRRLLPNLGLPQQFLVREAERMAINMPIQSLAADIIKRAMIETFNFLKSRQLYPDQARLVLSIHDELVFEVKDDKIKLIVSELKKIMESVYMLQTPLVVDTRIGKSLNFSGKNSSSPLEHPISDF